MLADVLSQLTGVQGLNGLAVGEPLTKNLRQIVLVLSQLIKNLSHSIRLLVLGLRGELHRVTASRFSTASEVQGECRGELAWPLLSRSLHSYSQLHDCEYKDNKKFPDFPTLKKLISNLFQMLKCPEPTNLPDSLLQSPRFS
jgi:hypothetical protein